MDLRRRQPVWGAMARLFWDAHLDESGITQIARILWDSGYKEHELEEILRREVAPVCYACITEPRGAAQKYWPRWPPTNGLDATRGLSDARWLGEAIQAHLTHQAARPDWWLAWRAPGRTGAAMVRADWRAVRRAYRGLCRDPERLLETLYANRDPCLLVDALDALALLGPRAHRSLTRVAELLEHRDFRVRAAATQAASSILGPGALGAVVATLWDPSPSVKTAAAAALRALLSQLAEPMPRGCDGTLRPGPNEHLRRCVAAQALGVICELLRDGKSADRLNAARIIESLGPAAKKAREHLIASFDDRNEAVRQAIADALVALNPEPDELLETLKRALFDTSARVRHAAALCLGRLLAGGQRRYVDALKALEAALDDPSRQVREGAIAALGWMGAAAAGNIPRLARLARIGEAPIRAAAVFALGQMDEAALRELPSLAAALGDPHPEVRRAALRAFARLGPLVRPMAPRFEACLDDPDWLTQFEARQTLRAICPERVSGSGQIYRDESLYQPALRLSRA